MDSKYTHYIGVRFGASMKGYFFCTDIQDLKINEPVIVDTIRGLEIGTTMSEPILLSEYKGELSLKPILRRANETDFRADKKNKEDAQEALEICTQEIADLHLPMNLVSAEYTLDRGKLSFSYLAESRVDFRELLRILASRFHTRIDLRQIGPRDRAKGIGGIGICGLPLCCSVFLNEFDGISINRAKNQLLSLNIPKLSGHCGKLICCLKFEDDAYSEAKKDFPEIGTRVVINGDNYRISSINILNKQIKLENPNDVQFLSLDEVKKIISKEKDKDAKR